MPLLLPCFSAAWPPSTPGHAAGGARQIVTVASKALSLPAQQTEVRWEAGLRQRSAFWETLGHVHL